VASHPSTYPSPRVARAAYTRRRPRGLVLADVVAGTALVAAIVVVGKGAVEHSGRSDTPTVLRAPATVTPETRPETNSLPREQMCARRGISIRAGDGTCILADGSEMTAADSGGRVRLESLEMRYDGARVVHRIGGGRAPLRPAGVFVRVKVTLTNRLDGTAGFLDDQITLALGPTDQFGPNSFANDADPQALTRRASSLDGGETVQGRVTFDVPPAAARRLTRFGSVRIVDFGNRRDAPRFGLIRTDR